MQISVWMDFWQMQCCGRPFAVGDEVSWALKDTDGSWLGEMLGPESPLRVDKVEDHHPVDDEAVETSGLVTSIHTVYWQHAPRPGGGTRELFAVPGSGVAVAVDVAERWVQDRGDLQFVGYLAALTLR